MTANERRLADKNDLLTRANDQQLHTIERMRQKASHDKGVIYQLRAECERLKAANVKLRREVE